MTASSSIAPRPPAARPQRIPYLDTLRSLAIIAVVLLHAAAWNWYRTPVDTLDWQVLNVYDSIVRFCVPVFFMVSGALFLQPARNITLASIFRKYIPRILVAYVLWSAFYAGLATFGPGGTGSLRTLVEQFVLGHYHLWFLFVLGGLYLVTPLLRAITADRKNAWYFVVLAFIFASVLPLLTHLPQVGYLIAGVLETTRMHLVLGYTLFFVLGYLLSTMLLTLKRVALISVLGVCGVVATAALTALVSQGAGTPNAFFYDYLTPNVVVAAIAVFIGVRALSERGFQADVPPHPIIALIGKLSFGIYLVHPFFQWLYQQFDFTAAFAPTIISVPLLTLAILVPSACVAWLLQRIPKFGSYIS
ncbi:acyltransferase family protein [Leucobacter sp. cx-328]|uniref:acyltransferase n=1 Tax=unclassified Leucobacter TaxID=2621730 RepID=UPI00165DF702|nr:MULTISPECIES: acyltransferase family protein [unclassified Leucobacter]MBC9943065.1 acyltransferase family protein [Leucobacter sp. cx-328]